jgi:hypothetical protein
MKTRNYLIATTVLAGGLLAAPAWAEVTVTVDVDKDKTIDVFEFIVINKSADIEVFFEGDAQGLAEADALVNATVSGNTVILTLLGDVLGDFNKRLAVIDLSVNGNSGVILQLNQDVGDNANQGNVLSAALVDVRDNPDTADEFEAAVAHAEAAVDQKNTHNDVTMITDFPGFLDPLAALSTQFHVRAEITDSVNGNTGGVYHVNQNAGVNVNQHNVLNVAIGLDVGLALGEGALGQENSDNHVDDVFSFKSAFIDGSINTNSGVVGVNQNVGHNNNQASVINIAATVAATNLIPNSNGIQ